MGNEFTQMAETEILAVPYPSRLHRTSRLRAFSVGASRRRLTSRSIPPTRPRGEDPISYGGAFLLADTMQILRDGPNSTEAEALLKFYLDNPNLHRRRIYARGPGASRRHLALRPARVVRELDALIALRGRPLMVVSDNVLCQEAALGFGQQVSSRRQIADVGSKVIQMVSTVNGIVSSHSKHRIQRH